MKNFLLITFVVGLLACGEAHSYSENPNPDSEPPSLLVPSVTKTLRINCHYMEEKIVLFEGFSIHISCFDVSGYEQPEPNLTVIADLQLIHETEE